MAVGALGLGYLLVRGTKETAKDVKEIAKKVQNKAINTEVTSGDRAGYTFAPVVKSGFDLVRGESPKDIGVKLVKTHTENVKDALNGPVPKWALPFTGLIPGAIINTLVD